jgi:hypothetical protein
MSPPIQRSERRRPPPEPSGQDERSPRSAPPGLPWFPGSGRRTRPSAPGRLLPQAVVGTRRPLWFRPGTPPARRLPPTAHLDLLQPLARGLVSRLATVRYALRSSAARPRPGLSFLPSHIPFCGPPGMPTTDCYSSGSPTLPPFGLSTHCSGLLSLVICSRPAHLHESIARWPACPRFTRRQRSSGMPVVRVIRMRSVSTLPSNAPSPEGKSPEATAVGFGWFHVDGDEVLLTSNAQCAPLSRCNRRNRARSWHRAALDRCTRVGAYGGLRGCRRARRRSAPRWPARRPGRLGP